MALRSGLAVVLASVFAVAASACGTDADGVTACKQIELARCMLAPSCGITLQPPYHSAGTDVDGCIRYYDIACLHGLEVPDPGPTVVRGCVNAIANGSCATVSAPETNPMCSWLVPPSSTTDAGSPSNSSDAASE